MADVRKRVEKAVQAVDSSHGKPALTRLLCDVIDEVGDSPDPALHGDLEAVSVHVDLIVKRFRQCAAAELGVALTDAEQRFVRWDVLTNWTEFPESYGETLAATAKKLLEGTNDGPEDLQDDSRDGDGHKA